VLTAYITMDLHAGQIQGSSPSLVMCFLVITSSSRIFWICCLDEQSVMLTAELGFAKRGRRYAEVLISRGVH
jgi:phosphoribosylpyrophosphate synthetase